jgi:hypothetical protein
MNVAQIELTGVWPKQQYRVFVAAVNHHGGETRPSLFGFGEDKDIWEIKLAKK